MFLNDFNINISSCSVGLYYILKEDLPQGESYV